MQIIFLNTEHGQHKKGLIPYLQKTKDITDIYCFQEAYGDLLKYGQEILSDFYLLSKNKVTTKSKFQQVTYIRNNIEILETAYILEKVPDTGLGIHIKFMCGDKTINLCNTHGECKPGDKKDTPQRIIQSQKLIDFYKDCMDPVIIGGDFNLDKGTKKCRNV